MICLTLSSKTLAGCCDEIRRNRDYIDIAELRLDLLDEKEALDAKQFPSMTDVPVILTFRRVSDGGKCSLSERARKQILLSALDGSSCHSCDEILLEAHKEHYQRYARECGCRHQVIPFDLILRIKCYDSYCNRLQPV